MIILLRCMRCIARSAWFIHKFSIRHNFSKSTYRTIMSYTEKTRTSSNLYWLYLSLFMCSKQVDFLWLRILFLKENFSIVWCLKTTLVSKTTLLKIRFSFTWIVVKVTKTSNNVKSRALILTTLGSLYSPRILWYWK